MLALKKTDKIEYILRIKDNNKVKVHEFIKIDIFKFKNICLSFYNPKNIWCILLLYDPSGNLRAQKMTMEKENKFYIDEEKKFTSPYCVSGEIEDGEWTLECYLYGSKELTFGRVWGILEITDEKNTEVIEDTMKLCNNTIYNTEKKWYAGDFHTHTVFSDGKMTRKENNCMAGKQGLDFFVATDHHIFPDVWPKTEEVAVFSGSEITSELGHMNVLFAEESPFKPGYFKDQDANEGLAKIMSEIDNKGIKSINHPFLNPWIWEYNDILLKDVTTLEIINDPTFKANIKASKQAVKMWDILLKDGHKMTGIGGSDSHLIPTDSYLDTGEPSLIGDPTTYVFSKNLSAKELEEALKKSNVVVSRGGFIDFNVEGCMSGEICTKKHGIAKVSLESPSNIEWVVDGIVMKKEYGNNSSYAFDFDDEYHYIRINLIDNKDEVYGFTNPVFFGEKETTLNTWGDGLKLMEQIDD